MNYRARPIEGSLLDLPIDPRIGLKYVTNTPGGHGRPIKSQAAASVQAEVPRDLGEERHHELLSALKGLRVTQQATQSANVTEALQQNRDWRG